MNIFADALDFILGVPAPSTTQHPPEQFSPASHENAITSKFLSSQNITQLAKRAQNKLPTLNKTYNEMLGMIRDAAAIWADQNLIGASTLLDESKGDNDDLITYLNNQFLETFATNFAVSTNEPDLNFDRRTIYSQGPDGNWEHKSVEFISPTDYHTMSSHDWAADEVYTADHRARNCTRVDPLSRSGFGSSVLHKVDRENPDGYAHADPDEASYDTQIRKFDMSAYRAINNKNHPKARVKPLLKHASGPWGS